MKIEIGMVLYEDTPLGVKERIVTAIGRKYFTVDNDKRHNFCIEDLKHVDRDYSTRNRFLYVNKEEIEDKKLHEQLSNSIRKRFRDWGNIDLSLDQLKKIQEIIEH